MNIDEYFDYLQEESKGKSFAFLAERVPTSDRAPHRIAVAKPIQPDETVVLVLAGSVGKGKHIDLFNGMLKKVDDFVKTQSEFKDKNVRVCIAVCDEGKHHHPASARELMFYQSWQDQSRIEQIKNQTSPEWMTENLNPAYVQDIYDLVFAPKIKAAGESKEELQKMLRSINTVTYCHGSYTGLKLEKMVGKEIKKFHLTQKEQKKVMQQMLFLNYAPDVPIQEAESQFISIESAQDSSARYQPLLKEYFQMDGADFGVLRIASTNVLMCAQVDKEGIEGNPKRVHMLKPINANDEDIADLLGAPQSEQTTAQEPKEEEFLREHSFLGFKPVKNMSKGALKLQKFANNILKNGILHSLNQPNTPLPNTRHLAASTQKQFFEFTRAWMTGHKQMIKLSWLYRFFPKKRQRLDGFRYWHQNNRIELD